MFFRIEFSIIDPDLETCLGTRPVIADATIYQIFEFLAFFPAPIPAAARIFAVAV